MLIALIFFGILIFIAIIGALALCKISAPNEEERKREDEEQMEYLRKWRENDKNKRSKGHDRNTIRNHSRNGDTPSDKRQAW